MYAVLDIDISYLPVQAVRTWPNIAPPGARTPPWGIFLLFKVEIRFVWTDTVALKPNQTILSRIKVRI